VCEEGEGEGGGAEPGLGRGVDKTEAACARAAYELANWKSITLMMSASSCCARKGATCERWCGGMG